MNIELRYTLRLFLFVLLSVSSVVLTYAQIEKDVAYYKDDLRRVEVKLREGDFQGGLALLDEIGVKYPDAADVNYAKSLIFAQIGNYDQAVNSAQAAYEKTKHMFYANHLLELYKSKKAFGEGIQLLKDLKQQYSNHEGLNRELLILYAENNQISEAESLYEDLIKVNHSDTLNLVMAEVYLNGNNLTSAKKILTSIQGKTLIGDVYGYLGYIYTKEGKSKEALSAIERGIKRTNDKSLYLDLADVYKGMDKLDAMYNALKTAFDAPEVVFWDKYKFLVGLMNENNGLSGDKLQQLANAMEACHPDVLEAKVLKGEILWKRENIEEARSLFLKVLSSNPKYVKVWRQIINTDLALGQPDEAIKHGFEGLKHNPNNTEIIYFTSLAYAVKEDYEKSKDLLETALNYSENDNNYLRSLIYGSLGDMYHQLKMQSMSDVAYEEAIALDSTNVSALNNYAYYLAQRKQDLEKAADFSKRTNDIDPNSATFMDTYAWVLFQQGKFDDALFWIEKAVKLDSKSSVLLEHYGDILSKLNRDKDAILQWKKALEIDLGKKSDVSLAKIQEKIQQRKYVE
ncbi:tetratricopeptide repeat protein [Sphingobacterium bovistauri]|uniref:Tetratricopeptide repeat-containing protein n=1 Tax=Sphingobacterium bovistauri TaxID=2781959 RepID=A0ABS7Z6X0_9SPHI|nr:tetratricopeptide repeat protein [Sphingobacterium bovistauri]MCA5005946.1 hypothetical protein [Sphingobacterium bovistauri]